MNFSRIKNILYVSQCILLLCFCTTFFWALKNLRLANSDIDRVEKQKAVSNQLKETLISIQNIETGSRGFVITGNNNFLQSYQQGIQKIRLDTIGIKEMNESPTWKSTTDSLNTYIKQKISHSVEMINIRKEEGEQSASTLVAKGRGLELSNKIKSQISKLSAFEINNGEPEKKGLLEFTSGLPKGLIVFIVAVLIFFLLNFFFLHKGLKEIESLNSQLKKGYFSKVNELNIVFDRITDAFIALDNDWKYTYLNQKAAQMYDMKIDDLIGKNIWEITPQIVNHPFKTKLMQAKETMQPMKAELYHAQTEQWFENWIYPDETGVSVYYRDVTERKKSEQILLDSKQKLELLNERFMMVAKATNDAIWDWQIGSKYVWGNETYRKIMEYESGEFIPLEWVESKINKEDLQKNSVKFQQAVSNLNSSFSEELIIRKKNGEEQYFQNTVNILYNEKEKAYRIVGTLQNITEERRIQNQILFEKELSDTLINSLPGVFYIFNNKWQYLRWNKNLELITGYSSEEIKNMSPEFFVPEEQREYLESKIRSVFNHQFENVEADLLTKDNRRIPYYFTGSFIQYNGMECLMGVGIDISDRNKFQKELMALTAHLQHVREEERANMAREIHDELGQQLTGIKMSISLLRNKNKYNDPEFTGVLNDGISMIDDTIKTVRRISTELRPSMLDDLGLVAALEWQTEEFQKRYFIESTFSCNHPSVLLPKDMSIQIFRIFQECLTNILRHSNATKITSNLMIENSLLIFEVDDNGVGINEKDLMNNKTLGILGMRERAGMLGGKLILSAKKEGGTKMTLSVPVEL